jgi:hypothetical protein
MASILLQLTVSAEVFDQARSVAAKILALHEKEVAALRDELATAPDARRAKLEARWTALHERARRITTNNVIRLAMVNGLEGMDIPASLRKIEAVGVAMGRPAIRKVG